MKNSIKIIASLFLLLFVMGTVFAACEINVNNALIELRNENDSVYSNWETNAERNEDIDVKISFDVTNYSTNCNNDIKISAKIYRYSKNTDKWSLVTTKTQTKKLDEDYYLINFNDVFNTGSNKNYSKYKIEGIISNGSKEIELGEGIVEVMDNSCEGIIITTRTINAKGNETNYATFTIENKTNTSFRITKAEITSTSSLINRGNVSTRDYVYAGETEDIWVELITKNVNNNTNVTAYLNIEGYLGNNFCSINTMGKKSFTVRIENNSLEQNWVGSNTDCDLIEINSFTQEFLEGTEQKIIIDLKNNSTKRFEILGVETNSVEMILSNYFYERFVFSGQTENIILTAKLPNVTKDTVLKGVIKVRGAFSDGRVCSFNQIKPKTIEVGVIDSTKENTSFGGTNTCANFFISTPEIVVIENNGSFNYTINNPTNKTATIIIESEMDLETTTIILPKNDSISKTMNIYSTKEQSQIKFTPKIEGCTLSPKTVLIKNNSKGTLNQTQISLTTNRDYEKKIITLSIEITNPTNKAFNSTMNIETPKGWPNLEKNIVINPGTNTFIEQLGASGETNEGEIKVIISAEGNKITSSTPTEKNNLGSLGAMGLFLLGANSGSIGIILLIILIVVLIIGVINSPNNTSKQVEEEWREK